MTPETPPLPRPERGVKILVVDDQPGIRLTLKGILTKKGYDVTVAESGAEAIDAVLREDFRLILMDVKMAGMSGVDAFVKIKEIRPSASVVMMTAFAVEDEIRRAIQEGATTVIHKPFDLEKVFGVIGECLKDQTLVLLVDDHQEDRLLFQTILERRGYKVLGVGSGEECLKEIREKRYQVILLDLRLPGINGMDTLKEIKRLQPGAGVIMITAYSEEKMMAEALQEGSYTCLQKPIDIEQFLTTIRQCLTQKDSQ